MNTALATIQFDDEKKALVKRTIAKDATDDELAMFLYQAERTGLDPFARQIYAIKRYDSKEKKDVVAIQISIDGMRLTAERSGHYDSQEGPYWCGKDGVWRDSWFDTEPPAAAKVLVYKLGSTRATTGIAHWAEYRQTYRREGRDELSPMWKKMPALMLAKCAEALALRKAFPMELSGLYTQEEMAQAEVVDVQATVMPALPAPTNGNGHKPEPAAPTQPDRAHVVLAASWGDDMPDGMEQWLEECAMFDRTNGPASGPQYGYIGKIVDEIAGGSLHNHIFAVLADRTSINHANPISAKLAGSLFDSLAQTRKDKATGATVVNEKYSATHAGYIYWIAAHLDQLLDTTEERVPVLEAA